MVVVAVWKENMFSLGNQLVSSAIRQKMLLTSRLRGKKKNFLPYLANILINIGEIWEHKTSDGTSTSQSTTPQMERGRHTGRDSRGEKRGDEESELQTTTSHPTSSPQSPPDLRRYRFEEVP